MEHNLRILSVVGARPNFMKIAPLVRALAHHNESGGSPVEHRLVHTGQHYDADMSRSFFDALDIPLPDCDLGIGSGSHAEQVGRTMMAFEPVLEGWRPDWVLVVGDVNAVCACSITAKKARVRLAHIEAGLRSFDLNMPEEINRMVADRLSDRLFTTDAIADEHLRSEGVPPERICRVGNIMIDTLDSQRDSAKRLELAAIIEAAALPGDQAARVAVRENAYAALTLHRPATVDDPAILSRLVDYLIEAVAGTMPLVWILHPRTRMRLDQVGILPRLLRAPNIVLLGPLGYHALLRLNMSARMFLTDSGGLQEECCVLGTPCLTLRDTTERPVTLRRHGGVCELAGNDPERIQPLFDRILKHPRAPYRPPLWDGHTAERIVASLTR